jgi:hypothetical protein
MRLLRRRKVNRTETRCRQAPARVGCPIQVVVRRHQGRCYPRSSGTAPHLILLAQLATTARSEYCQREAGP